MKNRYIYLFVLSVFLLSSCNNWLDMRPKSEMREEEMYETEDGFKSVLIGAYIKIASKELYGEKTTILLPELMSQHWITSNSNTGNKKSNYYISTFAYSGSQDVSNLLDNVWLNYYSVLVNLNNMMAKMEEKKGLFTGNNYNLIKGEALALRAFLHFEVLRLWGPVPSLVKLGDPAIPYVKEVSNDPSKVGTLSYREVTENIIADLNAAELLLEKDPLITYTKDFLNNYHINNIAILSDEFLYYRHNRFNIYAVKATKARFYLWMNNKPKAAEYAMQVINAVALIDGTRTFQLADETTTATSLIHNKEHIFAIHNPKLQDVITPLFINFDGLSQNTEKIKIAFESTLHSDDIRNKGTRYWEEKSIPASSTKQNMFKKYLLTETTSEQYVPVIRLSEMYLIAIECTTLSEASALFKTYRISRNMNNVIDNELVDELAVKTRLEKEYRKEFYGEGQMIYFYKRHNYTAFEFPKHVEVKSENYVLPIPNKQQVFE